jgi:Flp pilus assembly protein TadG
MKNPLRSAHLSASESGNALIELALSLPLFLLLMLGTAEIANLAWASVQVNNAARAAAAFASSSRTNAADITDMQTAAQNEAPKLTITFPTPPTQLCYCVSGGTPAPLTCDSNALTNCPSPSIIQMTIQVKTQAAVTPLVHYPGLPATYTVNAQATMGVAQ